MNQTSRTQIEARCVAIADTVVPNYRNGKRAYSCTSRVARMWQAAYDGAAITLATKPASDAAVPAREVRRNPDDPDWDSCPACKTGSLDTGYECNSCGFDAQPLVHLQDACEARGERMHPSGLYESEIASPVRIAAALKVASDTDQAEIKRLRGLLIDPGTPPWEDARAVLVAELRKAGYSTHADNVEAAHGVLIPSDIALNLIAQASQAKVASDTGAGLPRLTRTMMRAACKAHYGDDNIDGISLTVDGHDYNFAQGFARMWKGIRAALVTPTDATDRPTGGGETGR